MPLFLQYAFMAWTEKIYLLPYVDHKATHQISCIPVTCMINVSVIIQRLIAILPALNSQILPNNVINVSELFMTSNLSPQPPTYRPTFANIHLCNHCKHSEAIYAQRHTEPAEIPTLLMFTCNITFPGHIRQTDYCRFHVGFAASKVCFREI
jgi:hypothetical protein